MHTPWDTPDPVPDVSSGIRTAHGENASAS